MDIEGIRIRFSRLKMDNNVLLLFFYIYIKFYILLEKAVIIVGWHFIDITEKNMMVAISIKNHLRLLIRRAVKLDAESYWAGQYCGAVWVTSLGRTPMFVDKL